MTREELEEITTPSFGLDPDGCRQERLGDCTLELTCLGELQCTSADGKKLKSVPEAVKRGFAEDLKELKDAAKEIGKMRGATAYASSGCCSPGAPFRSKPGNRLISIIRWPAAWRGS